MAFRRKRRARVVWLPPAADSRIASTNPAVAGIQSGAFNFYVGFSPGAVTPDDHVTGYVPLVSDISAGAFQGSDVPAETLADIYSSGYRLRRIVGKIFCQCSQSAAVTDEVPHFLVTAGIIVLRTDPGGQPLSAATPNSYDPQAINQWADPWIWRRTWMLSNFQIALAVDTGSAFPENNTQYGSVMDGPHVDAKTARVIGREERLFLVVSIVSPLPANPAGATTSQVKITGDLRFVASMRQQVGNRRNASR